MKYFTFRELTNSATAKRLGIDNTPSDTVRARLEALVDSVLDPLRKLYNKPIKVTSGYRCPRLNAAVNGSSNSQHMRGEAADITSLNDDLDENKKILDILLKSGIEFDQLLIEHPDKYGRPDWIHISYTRRRANRNQILVVK